MIYSKMQCFITHFTISFQSFTTSLILTFISIVPLLTKLYSYISGKILMSEKTEGDFNLSKQDLPSLRYLLSALLQVATRTFWGHAKAPSYAIIAFSRLISSNAIANEPFAA